MLKRLDFIVKSHFVLEMMYHMSALPSLQMDLKTVFMRVIVAFMVFCCLKLIFSFMGYNIIYKMSYVRPATFAR